MDEAIHSRRAVCGRTFCIAASEVGICAVDSGDVGSTSRLKGVFGRVNEGESALLDRAWQQLDAYFAGDLQEFDLPLDMRLATPFGQQVMKALVDIPYGELSTYGSLARDLMSSPRAVGGAVGRNPLPVIVPCHRVVAADGSLGGYSGGLDVKRELLELEGHAPMKGGWEPSLKRW
jgi:methylated-DNA-[protein]-cysteine S-methyltransferase